MGVLLRTLFAAWVTVLAAVLVTGSGVIVSLFTGGTALGRIASARAELLRHVSVLFFAEGTRTHTGALGPFKKGAAAFGVQTGLPLVPVGIAGSREILPRGLRVLRSGPIAVSVGAPIATRGRSLDEREALTAELRTAVAGEIRHARALAGLE